MDDSTDARTGNQVLRNNLGDPESTSRAFNFTPHSDLDLGEDCGSDSDLGDVLAQIAEQLTRSLSESADPVRSMSPSEVLGAAAVAEQVLRAVQATQVTLAGRVAELCDPSLGDDSLAHQSGCRNEVEVLQRVTRAPGRALARRVRLAKRVAPRVSLIGETLPPLAPKTATAFLRGDVSLDCVELITKTLATSEAIAAPSAIVAAEEMMVDTATGAGGTLPLHDDDMRPYCLAVGARLDQDGPEPTETCPEIKRGFRFGKERDGLIPITGALLPEAAATLGRLIDAVNAPQAQSPVRFVPDSAETAEQASVNSRRSASENTTGDNGEDTPNASELDDLPYVDQRTGDQKRHDALTSVLEVMARRPEVPLLGGAPVTVLIQAKQSDLENERGTGWIYGHDGSPAAVPMSSVRHAACAGGVQRITQDECGRITQLEISQRIFNAVQRRAITLRDGGCIIPGCTIPGTWCEIHHVIEYAKGGPTHTDNGVLICWYHHRSLDSSGWEIRMVHGMPEIRPPGWIDPERRWYRTGSRIRVPDIPSAA